MEKGLISDPITFTRQIADDSTYLWNYAQPRLNMTTMSDQEAQEVYLELREMCDHNHRQSCARIIAMEQTTACLFNTTMQCPECSGEMSLTISYPPEAANSGKMDPTWPYFGIRGIHVLCQHCLGKMHLPSWYFPPMAARFAVMRNKIEALITEQRPVVVMPALDRYWGTFHEQIKLDGLNIVAAFDTRSHRLGKKFLGVTVEEATIESCKRFSDATFLLLPSGTIKPYLQLLQQAAIGAEQMVNWHGLEEDQLGSLANSRSPTR
ncbi:MAG: hypothetical protein G8345_17690 [Magnetococcales bacterium]|nr:hypothetical protein [Magnetococcales bacterium]